MHLTLINDKSILHFDNDENLILYQKIGCYYHFVKPTREYLIIQRHSDNFSPWCCPQFLEYVVEFTYHDINRRRKVSNDDGG